MAGPTLPSSIEFVNEQERAYFAEAVLGEEVRQFVASDVGRYLHGRAVKGMLIGATDACYPHTTCREESPSCARCEPCRSCPACS